MFLIVIITVLYADENMECVGDVEGSMWVKETELMRARRGLKALSIRKVFKSV